MSMFNTYNCFIHIYIRTLRRGKTRPWTSKCLFMHDLTGLFTHNCRFCSNNGLLTWQSIFYYWQLCYDSRWTKCWLTAGYENSIESVWDTRKHMWQCIYHSVTFDWFISIIAWEFNSVLAVSCLLYSVFSYFRKKQILYNKQRKCLWLEYYQ